VFPAKGILIFSTQAFAFVIPGYSNVERFVFGLELFQSHDRCNIVIAHCQLAYPLEINIFFTNIKKFPMKEQNSL
jgi:hypothetical protein